MADSLLIEDCEDAWTAGTGDMTVSADTGVFQVGTASAKVAVGAGAGTDAVMMYENISSIDITGYRYIIAYVRSSVALAEGDVQFGYDEASGMANPEEWISLPAMSANTWYRAVFTPTTLAAVRDAVVSIAFRMHVDKGAFDFYADDVRGFNGYTLSTVTNHLGTFSVFVGTSVPDLTIPTKNTIISFGDLTERMDFTPGNIDMGTLQIQFVDDYTVHANGFWYEVMTGECDVKILLDEGDGDTFVFWGEIQRGETKFTEMYVSGSIALRVGNITLLSLLARLKQITVASLTSQMVSTDVLHTDADQTLQYIRVADIFCLAVELAFSQTYDAGDCYTQEAGGRDFSFYDGTGYRAFTSLYVAVRENTDTPPAEVWARIGYNDSTDTTNYLGLFYSNAWDALKAIALQFGWIPRHVYDLTESRHKIQLVQRGRVEIQTVSMSAPRQSELSPFNPLKVKSVHAHRILGATHAYHVHDGITAEGEPGTGLEFDIDVPMLFLLNAGGTVNEFEKLVYLDGSNNSAYITQLNVYLYDDAGTTLFSGGNFIFQHAIVEYMLGRFPGDAQQTYYRTYHTVKVTNDTTSLFSHTGVSLGRETAIGGVNYMVSEYTKNFTTGELKLTLIDT
jgi:hypothetical protein